MTVFVYFHYEKYDGICFYFAVKTVEFLFNKTLAHMSSSLIKQ